MSEIVPAYIIEELEKAKRRAKEERERPQLPAPKPLEAPAKESDR